MTDHDPPAGEQDAGAMDRAADSFRLLGDPTRVTIIAELVAAQRAGETPLSFAEVRHRVGVSDSGRFNYHLKQLQPRFVQTIDDGYAPRYAATLVDGLVTAPAVSSETVTLEGPVDRPCVLCDDPPMARFASDRLSLTCETYDEQLLGMPVPPAVAADRSLAELVDFAEAYGGHQFELAAEGVCPHCWGGVETDLSRGELEGEYPDDAYVAVQVGFECMQCGHRFTMPLRNILQEHPAVAGFHFDHGIDLSQYGMLDGFGVLAVSAVECHDDRAMLRFDCEGDRLEIEVDDTLEIIEITSDA